MTNAAPRSNNLLAPSVSGRSRRTEPISNRVRRDGKFFRLGQEKFHVKGVTYGPFEPNEEGLQFPSPAQARRDFALMLELGANTFRVYHRPPRWLLDLALEMGLRVLIDVPWPKHLVFVDDESLKEQGREAVRSAARECGNHPAVFAISVVNEIPADIVRYSGPERIADFIDELVGVAKEEAPDCLVTFANYPTTEYLQPRAIDFVCFNVYLHDETVFRNYLARLQNIAGDKPLMLGEYGIDTFREHTEQSQAEILARHVRAVFEEGCAGTFIFAFTDDWFTGGWQIDNWAFGLVKRDRTPKASFERVKALFARAPQVADIDVGGVREQIRQHIVGRIKPSGFAQHQRRVRDSLVVAAESQHRLPDRLPVSYLQILLPQDAGVPCPPRNPRERSESCEIPLKFALAVAG